MKRCITVLLLAFTVSAQPPYEYSVEELKSRLPEPVLTDNPEWVDLYFKAWEIFTDRIKKAPSGSPFVEYFIDEAFSEYIYQWDTCLMLFFARYGYHMFPTITSLDNFYRIQAADGYICREPSELTGECLCYKGCENSVNPPIFSWAEWGHFKLTGDASRFSETIRSVKDNSEKSVLQRLIDYYHWVDNNRNSSEGLYWNTPLGCGLDNSPRSGSSWICMSAQMALNAVCIARIARVVGDDATAASFESHHADIKTTINEKLWDPGDGFYYDREGGGLNKVKTIGSSWPMVAEVSDRGKCAGVVRHLTDPDEFWRTHVFPSLAADEDGYDPNGGYAKGSVLASTNYQAVKGLEVCGYDSLAREAAANHIDNMCRIFQETGTIWENYAPDNVGRGNPSKPDFVGWSGCGPIALLIENVIGLTADAPRQTIRWRITRVDRHGIRNLHFGSNTVSLVCKERSGKDASPVISIETEEELDLEVVADGMAGSKTFEAGSYEWDVGSETLTRERVRGNTAGLRKPRTTGTTGVVVLKGRSWSERADTDLSVYSVRGELLVEVPRGAFSAETSRIVRRIRAGRSGILFIRWGEQSSSPD